MTDTIQNTDFDFPLLIEKYNGKVRDTYNIGNEYLVLVASDRISAFDHILPKSIPFKGQVLNQLSAYFLETTRDVVPNHLISVPDPNVTIGIKCEPIPIEMVVRGYLAGHAWRVYEAGGRELCGVKLPDGLKQNDKLPEPIITPATKSQIGHDVDISAKEIVKSGIVEHEEYQLMAHYALELFKKGTEMALERGLILVDTKYEFGLQDFKLMLIDEVHTPDSSRYFYSEGYEERQVAGEPQKQLSKEFVREWLMENGFQGLEGQKMPEMPDTFVREVSERYIGVYEILTGKSFIKAPTNDLNSRVLQNTIQGLEALQVKNI